MHESGGHSGHFLQGTDGGLAKGSVRVYVVRGSVCVASEWNTLS